MAIRPEGVVQSDIQVQLLMTIIKEASFDLFNFIQNSAGDKKLSYQKKLIALNEFTQKYNQDSRAWANIAIPELYLEGLDKVTKDIIDKDLIFDLNSSFNQMHKETIEALLLNSYTYTDKLVTQLEEQGKLALTEAQKLEISKTLTTGVITGTDRQTIVNNISGVLTGIQNGQNGLKAVNQAKLLSRSVLTDAQWTGSRNMMTQNGYDLVIVSDHFGECALCRPYENKVLSINGMYPQYTKLDTAIANGLKHLSCRHSISPYFEGFSEISKVYDVNDKKYVAREEYSKQDYSKLEKMTRQQKEDKYKGMVKSLGLQDYPDVTKAIKENNISYINKVIRDTENKQLAQSLTRLKPYIPTASAMRPAKDLKFDLKKELNEPSKYKIEGLTKYFDKTTELFGTKVIQDSNFEGFGVFDSKANTITINPTRKGKLITYLHELGHNIDYNTFGKLGFAKDEAFNKIYDKTLLKDVDQILYHRVRANDLELLNRKTLTYKEFNKVMWDLPVDYLKYAGGRTEIFAEGFGQYKANPEKFKKYAPTLFDYFSKIDKDIIDKLK